MVWFGLPVIFVLIFCVNAGGSVASLSCFDLIAFEFASKQGTEGSIFALTLSIFINLLINNHIIHARK